MSRWNRFAGNIVSIHLVVIAIIGTSVNPAPSFEPAVLLDVEAVAFRYDLS